MMTEQEQETPAIAEVTTDVAEGAGDQGAPASEAEVAGEPDAPADAEPAEVDETEMEEEEVEEDEEGAGEEE